MNRRGADRTGPLGGAGMVGLWGASSLLQSIQTGSVSITGTNTTTNTTITAVDTSRAVCLFVGCTNTTVSDQGLGGRISITSSTNLQALRGYQDGNTTIVYYVILEFMPGVIKSLQQSNVYYGSTTVPTATITGVNTNKTFIANGGWTRNGSNPNPPTYNMQPGLTLTNSTTVTGNLGAANDQTQVFTVVELF